MEGLEISEITFTNVRIDNPSFRLDSEYFRKYYINFFDKVKNISPLEDFIQDGYRVVYENTKVVNKEYAKEHNLPMFLQATDIETPFIKLDNVAYVDESDWIRYPKGRVKKGEILIEVKGKIEKVALVPDDFPEKVLITGSVYKMTLNNNINKYYLISYLTSKYGVAFKDRYKCNLLISFLSKDDLYRMPIPILDNAIQFAIESAYKKAISLNSKSLVLYSEAENILLEELGLKDWEPTNRATTQKSFEAFLASGRLDAEYYQPKYDELFAHLNKYETKRLGEVAEIKKSVEPGSGAYQDNGVPFIRVSNLSKFELSKPDIHLDAEEIEDVIRPRKDTILLSKDGSVGIAYKVREDMEAITSSAILHLTVKDEEFLPDYVTLVLNSIIVKMQAERDAGGSIIQHWKPSEIEQVIIPKLSDELQTQIAEKIQESFALKAESKRLLNLAKIAVETAIEHGEEKALERLKS